MQQRCMPHAVWVQGILLPVTITCYKREQYIVSMHVLAEGDVEMHVLAAGDVDMHVLGAGDVDIRGR